MRLASGINPASSDAAVMVSECRSTASRDTVSAVPRKNTAPFPTEKAAAWNLPEMRQPDPILMSRH